MQSKKSTVTVQILIIWDKTANVLKKFSPQNQIYFVYFFQNAFPVFTFVISIPLKLHYCMSHSFVVDFFQEVKPAFFVSA